MGQEQGCAERVVDVPQQRSGVAAEVHGGLLWGTWTCTCRAGGSAWSRHGAERALAAHVRDTRCR